MSINENGVRHVWINLDLQTLPDYETFRRHRWYRKVNWTRVTELARPLIQQAIAEGVEDVRGYVMSRIPPRTPQRIQEGIWSLFISPIEGTRDQITDGGHRITAMRRQGLQSTVGVTTIDDDFDLASDTRIFPGQ